MAASTPEIPVNEKHRTVVVSHKQLLWDGKGRSLGKLFGVGRCGLQGKILIQPKGAGGMRAGVCHTGQEDNGRVGLSWQPRWYTTIWVKK